MECNLLLALAVHCIPFLKPAEELALVRSVSGPDDLLRMRKADLERTIGRRVRSDRYSPVAALEEAEAIRKGLTAGRFACTFYWDRSYPPQLREIYDPPLLLYYRGELPDYGTPMIGIVGTRYPSGRGRKAAFRLGHEFGGAGVAVVSGLARGIDGSAHAGTVASGGTTVAVLGNGIDSIYPVSNAGIARDILRTGGCIVSEFAPGTPPLRYNFPFRNRIISGLSRGIVVIEAPARSGALITADYALEHGRDLYVHADGTAGTSGEGCRNLSEAGAPVVTSAAEVLKDWGWELHEMRTDCGSRAQNPAQNPSRDLERELAGTAVKFNGEVY